eukprot:scaffold34905_cov17-Tisochrysis_lutea.AAC.6
MSALRDTLLLVSSLKPLCPAAGGHWLGLDLQPKNRLLGFLGNHEWMQAIVAKVLLVLTFFFLNCWAPGKALLRRFDDQSEGCRELAAITFLGALHAAPQAVLALLPYAVPVLEERLCFQANKVRLQWHDGHARACNDSLATWEKSEEHDAALLAVDCHEHSLVQKGCILTCRHEPM